ncbi:MAG: hypothetical protein ACK44F_13360, partial [Roseococcus sp.]
TFFVLLVPLHAPAVAAHLFSAGVGESLPQPSVLEVFRVQAAVPVTSSPEEMRAFIAADRERWNAVVRDLNIRLE